LSEFPTNNKGYDDGKARNCLDCKRKQQQAYVTKTPRDKALVPVRTDTVTVMDREFVVGWHAEALYWPVKPFVEAAGLGWSGQEERVKNDKTLAKGIRKIRIPLANGGPQEMLCLPWSLWHTFWMGTHAPQAERFRTEAAQALALVFGETAGDVLAPTSVEQRVLSVARQIDATGITSWQPASEEEFRLLIRTEVEMAHEEERALVREMARRMGILTDIRQDTAAILGAIGSATVIHSEQVWKAQIYICRLISPAYLTLTRREYPNIPDNAEILFIGKTGPHGNIQDIRIADYGGKWDVLPEDYEVIATFGTDAPADVENTLLQHPLPDCMRLVRGKTGQKSKTFIAAMNGAEQQYKRFTEKHYTYQVARMLLSGFVGQMDLFGGAA
jgi:hypothetical protein